jgi:hypothetical protein
MLDAAAGTELPPLLSAAQTPVVHALGRLDQELLLVLESGRLLPEDVLERLTTAGGSH